MKKECNRAILFAKVNEEKENLISLIHIDDFEECHIVALSDEQISIIDEHLLVRSLEEFQEKFDFNFENIEFEEDEESESNEKVQDFYHALVSMNMKEKSNRTKSCILTEDIGKSQGEEYRIWYYAGGETSLNVKSKKKLMDATKQYEIWLGVKAFFEQAKGRSTELLIANISCIENNDAGEWQSDLAYKKLKLYMDTVNDKLDCVKKIAYAIFPEIPMVLEKSFKIRERFDGNRRKGSGGEISYDMLARMIQLMESRTVMSCYQFETGELSSARILASEGRGRQEREAEYLEQKINCTGMSCCYPNLTWIEDDIYIGAAYVVAGMLTAGYAEGSVTDIPRELYPYQPSVEEEITAKFFGSMLAYVKQAGEPYMRLHCARSGKWCNGEYEIIARRGQDV